MNIIETVLITRAHFSEEGSKRYLLEKTWDESKPKLAIIMLAPSIAEGISLDNARKMIENAFQAEEFQAKIDILAEELKIKKEEAANAARYFAAQVLGMEADNAWKDAAWIVEQANGTATLIKYGGEMAMSLVNNVGEWLNPKTWFRRGKRR